MRSWALAALLASGLPAMPPMPPMPPESGWLPPAVEAGSAQQLADRLRPLGDGKPDEAKLGAASRDLVRALRDTLGAWGADGVVARAPVFPELEVPAAREPQLDAIGRWNVCLLVFYLQLEDPALAGDGDAQLTSILGLSAVTLAVLRVREPYVAAGGSDEALEAHLTGPETDALLKSFQSDAKRRGYAEARCQPVVRELLAAPIAYLRDQGPS